MFSLKAYKLLAVITVFASFSLIPVQAADPSSVVPAAANTPQNVWSKMEKVVVLY